MEPPGWLAAGHLLLPLCVSLPSSPLPRTLTLLGRAPCRPSFSILIAEVILCADTVTFSVLGEHCDTQPASEDKPVRTRPSTPSPAGSLCLCIPSANLCQTRDGFTRLAWFFFIESHTASCLHGRIFRQCKLSDKVFSLSSPILAAAWPAPLRLFSPALPCGLSCCSPQEKGCTQRSSEHEPQNQLQSRVLHEDCQHPDTSPLHAQCFFPSHPTCAIPSRKDRLCFLQLDHVRWPWAQVGAVPAVVCERCSPLIHSIPVPAAQGREH